MPIIARRLAIMGSCLGLMLPGTATRTATAAGKAIGQRWIDGWNAADPSLLADAFTPDATYEASAMQYHHAHRRHCEPVRHAGPDPDRSRHAGADAAHLPAVDRADFAGHAAEFDRS